MPSSPSAHTPSENIRPLHHQFRLKKLHRPLLFILLLLPPITLYLLSQLQNLPNIQLSLHPPSSSPPLSLPPSHLRNTLIKARLSHIAFHAAYVKDHLLQLVTRSPSDAVIVIGVSDGKEVLRFADASYHVYAFEPSSKDVAYLQRRVNHHPDTRNVSIFQMAATHHAAPSTNHTVRYAGTELRNVRRGRAENYVPNHFNYAVLSVDVQGEEYSAIRGCDTLISAGSIRSIWVEIIACNEHALNLLNFLDRRYVLFDFVAWGHAKRAGNIHNTTARESFLLDQNRPSLFKPYLDWLCSAKRQFFWVQTDIVAIDRDMFHPPGGAHLMRALAHLHVAGCAGSHKCALRNLMPS